MMMLQWTTCGVLLVLASASAFAQGNPPLPAAREDKVPVPEDEINATSLWRFVTAEWPLSSPDNTTWGVASVRAYSTKRCLGDQLEILRVTYGGGNWSKGFEAGGSTEGYDYDDYDVKDEDDDYWEGPGEDGSGEDDVSDDGSSGEDDGSDDGSSGEDGGMAGLVELEEDGTFFTSSLGGPVVYKLMPSMSCKDRNLKSSVAKGGYAECQKRCNLDDSCRAFTYNVVTHMCFLKEECFKLRKDRRSLDISGVILRDLRDGASGAGGRGSFSGTSGDPEQDDAKMEANAAAEQAELEAHVKHWEDETASIKDSPLGGAYIQVRLVGPEVVRCMQFVVPPRLKAQFPQAARIQFSSDNGTSWRTSQGLEPIGQESLLVKTVSKYADAAFLETRGGLHPAPPPPPGPAPSGALINPQASLSQAVAAAMKAAKEASAAKGVTFKNSGTGFAFTVGMMLVGSVLFCCCVSLCRRRNRQRKQRASQGLSSAAGQDEEGFSDIELTDTAPQNSSVLSVSAGALIDGVVSTLSPKKTPGPNRYNRD